MQIPQMWKDLLDKIFTVSIPLKCSYIEIFLRYLGQKCLLFSIIKVRCIHSLENFHGTVDNCEKYKGLAQQIFPHLRYVEYTSKCCLAVHQLCQQCKGIYQQSLKQFLLTLTVLCNSDYKKEISQGKNYQQINFDGMVVHVKHEP